MAHPANSQVVPTANGSIGQQPLDGVARGIGTSPGGQSVELSGDACVAPKEQPKDGKALQELHLGSAKLQILPESIGTAVFPVWFWSKTI